MILFNKITLRLPLDNHKTRKRKKSGRYSLIKEVFQGIFKRL